MQKYFCQKLKNAWHIVANRYTLIYLQMYHLKFNCTLFHFIGLFIVAKCDCLKKGTKTLSSSMKNILGSGFKSTVSSIHVFWPRMYLSKFWSNAAKWQGPWNDRRSFWQHSLSQCHRFKPGFHQSPPLSVAMKSSQIMPDSVTCWKTRWYTYTLKFSKHYSVQKSY